MSTTELNEPQTPDVSTELDTGKPVDPGQAAHKEEQEPQEEPKQPKTRMDAIKQAEADLKKPVEEEGEEKAKKEEKAEKEEVNPDESTKPVKASKEDDDGDEGENENRSEKEQGAKEEVNKAKDQAPARFLPAAKEKWANVPREVKGEIVRLEREHQAELEAHKEAVARYDRIRQYDDLARQNGRDLNYTLQKVVELETMMQRSPIAALNQMLIEAGPRKPDGQPISLMEVAQFIVSQGPQGYQQAIQQAQQAPQQQQQQQGDPRVEQLQQQIAQMQQQQLASSIIEPFKATHPRFDELKEDIAFFLQSGKVPQGLSPSERLAAAYDYAVRINPSSQSSDAGSLEVEQPESRAANNLNGKKSITGAPASGADTKSRRRGSLSRKDAIDAAMSELLG